MNFKHVKILFNNVCQKSEVTCLNFNANDTLLFSSCEDTKSLSYLGISSKGVISNGLKFEDRDEL